MTQILALLTQDHVYLAADCRLSIKINGEWKIAEDNAAKLVNLGGSHFCAYSGSSRLGRRSTKHWIAYAMYQSGHDGLSAVVRNIQSSCMAAMPAGVPSTAQHFVIVGFKKFPKSDSLRPHFTIISNRIDERGRWQATHGPMRAITLFLGSDKNGALHVAGQQLRRIRRKRLQDDLRSLTKINAEPKQILQRLVAEIRFTSFGRRNKFVGPRVLAGFVPRSAEELLRQGEEISVLVKEPERDDAWPNISIYDAFGQFVHDYVGLVSAKNDTQGKWIIETTRTSGTPDGAKWSIEIKVVKAPAPLQLKSSRLGIFFGDAKIRKNQLWQMSMTIKSSQLAKFSGSCE